MVYCLTIQRKKRRTSRSNGQTSLPALHLVALKMAQVHEVVEEVAEDVVEAVATEVEGEGEEAGEEAGEEGEGEIGGTKIARNLSRPLQLLKAK
jgi:hypothetical protein